MGITKEGVAGINPAGIFDHAGLKLVSAGFLCAATIFAAAITYSGEIKKQPSQTCQPKDNEVIVQSANGKCAVRGPGIYSNPSAIGLGGEPINMIYVPRSIHAAVCGLDTFSDLNCEELSWRHGKKFQELASRTRWTYLKVAPWNESLECRPKGTEVMIVGSTNRIGPCIRLA
jgi:hypothetical protein